MAARQGLVRRRGIKGLVIAAGVIAALTWPVAARATTVTNFGPVGFASIAVDDAHQHVFVSLPSANAVAEFDFAGNLITTVPNVYGAWGMTVSGNYLYVAESTSGEIVRIDLTSTPLTPQKVISGLNQPRWLVTTTDGTLWTTVTEPGYSPEGYVVAVSGGHTSAISQTFYEPDLAVSPGDPNTLFVAEDGLTGGSFARFDVSTSPPTETAWNINPDQDNIENLAVSPDGTRLIPASGWPYDFEELSASTLQADGIVYPAAPYPQATAVSQSGLLAADFGGSATGTQISIFPLGTPSAIASWTSTAYPVAHGLALSADGSMLFAVTTDWDGDTIFFAIPVGSSSALPAPPPPPPPPSPPPSLPAPSPPTGAGSSDPPSGSGPTSKTSPSAAPHFTIKAFKSGLKRPDLSGELGAVRVSLSTGEYRYFLAAQNLRCTSGATNVIFTVAHRRYITACQAGLILISRVTPHRVYTLHIRAVRMHRHRLMRQGRTHTWRMYMPGNEIQWGPLP